MVLKLPNEGRYPARTGRGGMSSTVSRPKTCCAGRLLAIAPNHRGNERTTDEHRGDPRCSPRRYQIEVTRRDARFLRRPLSEGCASPRAQWIGRKAPRLFRKRSAEIVRCRCGAASGGKDGADYPPRRAIRAALAASSGPRGSVARLSLLGPCGPSVGGGLPLSYSSTAVAGMRHNFPTRNERSAPVASRS